MNLVKKRELIELLTETGALEYGQFTLASGKSSSYYFDGKRLSLSSKALPLVVSELVKVVWWHLGQGLHAIGGPELGAVPLVGGMLTHIGIVNNLEGYSQDIAGFIVRKQAKGHGTKRLVDGQVYGEKFTNVVIVEDVTTTGQSAMKAVDAIEELGHKVGMVITILDREEGARKLFEDRKIVFESLLEAKDIIKKEVPRVDWDGDALKS